MADVPVILDWSALAAWAAVRSSDRAVHLLTNSRAHDGREAARLVRSAAQAARERLADCRFLLRGDSTLRGHVWDEYQALRSVVHPGRDDIPLLLVPALPEAGRITIEGVHLIEREGERVPLHLTEYATDGGFAYTTALLSRWAEERSNGRFAAGHASTVGLARLREPTGAQSVADAIQTALRIGGPAVVVPDAEVEADLYTIAEGLRATEAAGAPVLVRSAPAFAATLTGTRASSEVRLHSTDGGVLVLCGSFVSNSTAQIEEFSRSFPDVVVTARVAELAGEGWEAEVERVSAAARQSLRRKGLAAVATERRRDPTLTEPESQRRIATALAQVARALEPGIVIAKGGITSAVTAREGLDAVSARVVGPIRPGVSLWQLPDGRDYVVVPGNVGGPRLLVDVVMAVAPSLSRALESSC